MRITLVLWALLLLVHCQRATVVKKSLAEANAVVGDAGPATDKPVDGKRVPADFPLPIYFQAEVRSATRLARDQGAMFNVTILTDQTPGEAADFYRAVLATMGIKNARHVLESGDSLTVMLHGHDDKNRVIVQASKKRKNAKTTVLLHWVKD